MKDVYVLSNYINHTNEINLPLKHTQRIKYTCFDASKNYLIFGATSGSLYIFQRKPTCKFLQLIPTKYRSVTKVAISPNERYVAFTTQKGVICVLVINISANSIPQLITTTIRKGGGEGRGGGVGGSNGSSSIGNGLNGLLDESYSSCSAIHWSSDEKQFYYGNSKGEVYLITLTLFIVGKTLIDITIHPILYLDSSIVQIYEYDSLLLVSNLMKCILCNMDYEEYKQIGNQPRDGKYGACFSILLDRQHHQHQQQQNNDYIISNVSRIYCARPGYRIWEVNLEGNVIKTHEFKNALKCPPTKIIDDEISNGSDNDDDDVTKTMTDKEYENDDEMMNNDGSMNEEYLIDDNRSQSSTIESPSSSTITNQQFSKLQTINNGNFILTYSEDSLYILDPREASLILWSNKFQGILDCIVIDNEIIIFTKFGQLYRIYLQKLQSLIIDLIHQHKMMECIKLLKKNLKYFSEKSKEDYNLYILNEIKLYLIKNNQYDTLNDLSVIFDCLTLRKDNYNNPTAINNFNTNVTTILDHQYRHHQQQPKRIHNGVYILENAFCDNLKNKSSSTMTNSSSSSAAASTKTLSSSDKLIKDMLLTVTGKFGKNIIKYKFNIFNDEQKSLVEDLIPIEKNVPFQEIYDQYDDSENDDLICNHVIVKKDNASLIEEQKINEEEKTVYDLYLIWKSSKISNICFLDRYRTVFDRYTSKEIINLLSKLEKIMIENGDKVFDAKQNCYEMYFNYLKPELLWELDDDTRDYIKNGFILLNNQNDNMINCNNCKFPIQFSTHCLFRNIGDILFKFYQSRNEQELCLDLIKNVPSLIDLLCKYLIQKQNHNIKEILILVLNYGDSNLLEEISNHYLNYNNCNEDDNDHNELMIKYWEECFELFSNIQLGKFQCSHCSKCIFLNGIIEKNPFYTWNCFLSIALNYLNGDEILSFILKYSNLIANNCIEREIFIRCLLK